MTQLLTLQVVTVVLCIWLIRRRQGPGAVWAALALSISIWTLLQFLTSNQRDLRRAVQLMPGFLVTQEVVRVDGNRWEQVEATKTVEHDFLHNWGEWKEERLLLQLSNASEKWTGTISGSYLTIEVIRRGVVIRRIKPK